MHDPVTDCDDADLIEVRAVLVELLPQGGQGGTMITDRRLLRVGLRVRVVWVIRPVDSPICSISPVASTSALSGFSSWYFSDDEPELITSTGPAVMRRRRRSHRCLPPGPP